MFQIAKYNLLIPIQYDPKDTYKLSEERIEINKADVNNCKANREFGSKLWFQYCFKEKAFEKNYQMINSPLLQDETYKMTRIELDSVARDRIGVSKRENTTYVMDKNGIPVSIGKVRMLFTNNRIGFIHIEIFASDIDENAVRKLGYAFSKVTSSQPKMSYQKRRSKEQYEDVTISFKEIIDRIVALQTYIPISIYDGRITPYMQISLIGSCDSENKEMFFDSVQALSQRPSTKCIDESRVYEGREAYISRFVGDKTVCIYGDTGICGEENTGFLMDIGNGLVKSATENYTTVYAFLISVRLLLLCNQRADYDLGYLIDMPVTLSDEDNIREFYEQCIWNSGWKLKEERNLLLKKLDKNDFNRAVEALRLEFERQRKAEEEQKQEIERLRKMSEEQLKQSTKNGEILVEISQGVGLLVDFVNTELKSFLAREKQVFNQSNNKNNDGAIGLFVRDVSDQIDKRIITSGNDAIEVERKNLSTLFGDKWKYVMASSQSSLISSGVLLKQCSDITAPDFDWSGVCICATAALEAELKRVFFDGLLDYMVSAYGQPCSENSDEIYKNWPEALLSVPRYQFVKGSNMTLTTIDNFTMGKLPFLFGETGKLSDKDTIRRSQLEQSELMKKCMTEYLATIVLDYYKEIPFELFYIGTAMGDRSSSQAGCFVWKCEQVRKNYRNKAAHVNVMSGEEAASCYQSIITKPYTYIYNAEIAGIILELFSKIDGSKLNEKLHEKKNNSPNSAKKANAQMGSGQYSVGQAVELGELEVTSKGVLRGTIVGSSEGASLSKKYLQEMGIYPRQYLGKTIKVKLVRWDKNGQKFNAEFI